MEIIKNINEYLNTISQLRDTKNETRFFRGHANAKKYEMIPGIYRKINKEQSLINYESQIFREVICQVPRDFEGKSTLESLVLMQHYGVPTRILDITQNALVALYFACNSNRGEKGSNGEVIILDIPNESVCHYNSDRISILTNLVKENNYFDTNNYNSEYINLLIFKDIINEYTSCLASPNFKSILMKEKIIKHINSLDLDETSMLIKHLCFPYIISIEERKKEFIIYLKTYLKNVSTNLYEKYILEINEDIKGENFEWFLIGYLKNIIEKEINIRIHEINKSYKTLLNHIKEDKPYFEPRIRPEDISTILAVKPKLDNPRILKQHGAFLVYGINNLDIIFKKNGKCLEINQDWFGKTKENKKLNIIIDKNSKDTILKELDILGINQSTLFPEIDKVADSIRAKYEGML